MSIIDYWLTETVDVQRLASTRDAMGGQVNTWATWTYDADSGKSTAAMKCKNWIVSIANQNQNQALAGQPLGVGLHNFAFAVDFGATITDRIKHTRSDGTIEYFQVQGTPEFYEMPAFPGLKMYVITGLLKQY